MDSTDRGSGCKKSEQTLARESAERKSVWVQGEKDCPEPSASLSRGESRRPNWSVSPVERVMSP